MAPTGSWIHTHRFEPSEEGATLMEDRVDYRLPFGALGRLAAPVVALQLRTIFSHRFRRVDELYPPRIHATDHSLEYPTPGSPEKGDRAR